MQPYKTTVVVIGAGISGLTCAYELQSAGFDVHVIEKEAWVGGRMSTRQKGSLPFDFGADHLGNIYEQMKKYCQKFGIAWVPMIDPSYGIYRDGKILPIYKATKWLDRMRFAFFSSRLGNDIDFFNTSTAAKYDTDNSYDFIKKVAGQDTADYLAEGLTSAYQFHRAREAGKGALMAYMQSVKNAHGLWALHKTQGGMIALSKAFAERLPVTLSAPVLEVTPHPGGYSFVKTAEFTKQPQIVVMACTANVTNKILKNQTEKQKKLLDFIQYAPTISLSYSVYADILPKETVVFTPYVQSQTVSSYTNQKMKGEEFIKDGKSLVRVWLHDECAKKIFDKPDNEI